MSELEKIVNQIEELRSSTIKVQEDNPLLIQKSWPRAMSCILP